MHHTLKKTSLLLLAWLLLFLLAGCSQAPAPGDPFRDLQTEQYQISDQAQATFLFLSYLELQEQEPEKALEHLQDALEKDPHPELYLELAQFYWSRQEHEQAEELLLQARRKFPQHADLVQALARLYNNQEQEQKARDTLRLFLMEQPEEPRVRSRLAELQLEHGLPEQALNTLEKLQKEDLNARMHLLMGRAYLKLDNRQEAVQQLRQATELNPRFVRAWAELAYQYELNRDYVQARDSYQRLLQLGMDNQEVYIRLIDISLKLNNPEQALQTVQEGPDSENFLLQACNLFLQQDFFEQAKEILEQMQEKGYASPRQDLLQAILAYKGDQDSQQALEILEGIPEDSEYFERGLDLQARLLYQMNMQDQALEKTRQGRETFPENQRFWLLESEILQQKDQLQESKKLTSKALEKFPEDSEILYQMGFIQHQLEEEEQALEFMEKVINQDPEYAPALNFVGYSLAEQGQDLQRALILIKKALQEDPENGFYLDSLAWVYFRSGNLEQAWEHIQKAVEQVQDDPIIWEHYGDIAAELNKQEQAREAYQKSLELDPKNARELEDKLDSL
ncbi:MAG: tetratricopeptide repeat protein [Desulfohalobiaceae bacterium]